jgi:hypothetical protein
MLSERTIINGLLVIAGMILGPYLIILTFEVNQIALLSFAAIVFLFAIFFFVKDRICAFPFLGSYFGGTLNFLPLGFTPIEVFSLTTILYYFVNYVALKRRPLDGGPRSFIFPMLVIGAIVLVHDHSMKVFGGGQEGSRPGLLILLSIVAYLCAINIPSPSTAFWSRLPWWCLFLTCLGSAPFIITTYIPSLAPYIFYISGNVNLNAYMESVGGTDASDTERNIAFLGIGGVLQGILVAYFPINTWWQPRRWIVVILSLLCLYTTLSGGYRNGLLSFALTTFIGAICYCRWRVLIMLPMLLIVPLGIIFIQNDHPAGITLSGSVQRTMSFLPGRWDEDVIETTDSSNDFRAEIERIYKAEFLYKSPWIGNGFSFDPSEPEALDAMSKTPGVTDPAYYSTKAFIVSKNMHVGWISLYDAVGIIGGIAFIFLNVAMIWTVGRLIFGQDMDPNAPLFPLKIILFSSLTGGLVGFFTTFGNFSGSFIGMCTSAIVLVNIIRIDHKTTANIITSSPQLPMRVPRRAEVFSPLGNSTN